jgi:hypothetical protein
VEAGDTGCGWPIVCGLMCEVGSAAAAVVVHGGVSTEYCAVVTCASEVAKDAVCCVYAPLIWVFKVA